MTEVLAICRQKRLESRGSSLTYVLAYFKTHPKAPLSSSGTPILEAVMSTLSASERPITHDLVPPTLRDGLKYLAGIDMPEDEILRHIAAPNGFHPTSDQVEMAVETLWAKHGHVAGRGFAISFLKSFFKPQLVEELRAHPLPQQAVLEFDKRHNLRVMWGM
jgi:hypothetical protein